MQHSCKGVLELRSCPSMLQVSAHSTAPRNTLAQELCWHLVTRSLHHFQCPHRRRMLFPGLKKFGYMQLVAKCQIQNSVPWMFQALQVMSVSSFQSHLHSHHQASKPGNNQTNLWATQIPPLPSRMSEILSANSAGLPDYSFSQLKSSLLIQFFCRK